MDSIWEDRHSSVKHFRNVLRPNPSLPDGKPREIADEFWILANKLLRLTNDGPELSAALRKLWEAKNCAVLQAVMDNVTQTEEPI
jgi:hypothetical protein